MGELARAEQQGRGLVAGRAELAFQRNEAVGVGAGHAEIEVDVGSPSRLLDDLVELLVAVEGKAPHAERAIGPRDGRPRLHRVHEEQLGAGDAGEPLDLGERGHVEGPDTGLRQGIDDQRRIVRLGGVEHPPGEVGEKPARGAGRRLRP